MITPKCQWNLFEPIQNKRKYDVLERSTHLQVCSRMWIIYPGQKNKQTKKNPQTPKHLLLKLLAVVLLNCFHFSEKSYTHTLT